MSNITTQIENVLNEGKYKYTYEAGIVFQEYRISSDLPYKLFIRCRSSEFVGIHYWIELDKAIVSEKRVRLLDFCNITSWEGLLNAKLYDDGIDISYTIPDGAGDALSRLVINALYEFFMRIDHTMLSKALETEDDLYLYHDSKVAKENEEIRKRIQNHNEKRSTSN